MANTMANTMIIMTGSKGMYENRDDQFTADQVSPLGKSSQPYGARACQKSQTSTLLFTNILKDPVKNHKLLQPKSNTTPHYYPKQNCGTILLGDICKDLKFCGTFVVVNILALQHWNFSQVWSQFEKQKSPSGADARIRLFFKNIFVSCVYHICMLCSLFCWWHKFASFVLYSVIFSFFFISIVVWLPVSETGKLLGRVSNKEVSTLPRCPGS